MGPVEINTLVVGSIGAVVSAATYWRGRSKAAAEADLTREQARKVRAEADRAETAAQLDAIAGELTARLDRIEATQTTQGVQISEISHEVRPNHGGSMKDALARVEAVVGEVKSRMDRLDARQARLDDHAHDTHARQWARLDALADRLDRLEEGT